MSVGSASLWLCMGTVRRETGGSSAKAGPRDRTKSREQWLGLHPLTANGSQLHHLRMAKTILHCLREDNWAKGWGEGDLGLWSSESGWHKRARTFHLQNLAGLQKWNFILNICPLLMEGVFWPSQPELSATKIVHWNIKFYKELVNWLWFLWMFDRLCFPDPFWIWYLYVWFQIPLGLLNVRELLVSNSSNQTSSLVWLDKQRPNHPEFTPNPMVCIPLLLIFFRPSSEPFL